MDPIFYTVELIDGDYAQLRNLQDASLPLKPVALALLPDGISEGTRLKWEMFEYEIV